MVNVREGEKEAGKRVANRIFSIFKGFSPLHLVKVTNYVVDVGKGIKNFRVAWSSGTSRGFDKGL